MSIKSKILLSVLISILILGGHSLFSSYQNYENNLAELKKNTQERLHEHFSTGLRDQLDVLTTTISMIAANTVFSKALAEGDRETLTRELLPYFQNTLKPKFGIHLFHFHTPPATSFLRLHRLERYGDDLTSFRHMVVQTNRTQQPVTGLEVGREGVGLRVVQPVFHDQQHVGSVEFGGSMAFFMEKLKYLVDFDYAIGIKKSVLEQSRRASNETKDVVNGDTVFYIFSSNHARKVSADMAHDAHEKQASYQIEGREHLVYHLPLTDYSDTEIGMIVAAQDIQTLKEELKQALLNKTLIIFGIASITFLALFFLISRVVVAPLQKAVGITEAIAQGNLSLEFEATGQDETGRLLQALHGMLHTQLRPVIEESGGVLERLANGDFTARIQRTFLGDFEKISLATNDTAAKLSEATEQNTLQTWLKSGQGQLSEQTSGDKTLLELAKDIINFLTPYLDAQVGAFYLAHREEGQELRLRMIASHAYTWRKSGRHEFQIGEGLVGQAALEHKSFVIEEPPPGYLHIQSGLGSEVPRMILVAPFLYEEELKGVIELASFKPFNETHLEFLKQTLPAIAIAINTAESRNRMKELLTQSEAQSAALREQQARMETQQQELEASNEKLTVQTEELQSQSEELQAQQEELRQTNEQLEERTRELERQQSEVEQKNTALEKAKSAIQLKAEELELTSKYKSEFLANMSHELRTPLNSLLILAQMLAENQSGHLDEKEVQQAQTIHGAGSDLLTLINDILDLSKVEAGKVQLHIETFPLSKLLAQSQQRFQPLAERKGLAFHTRVAEGLPQAMTSDAQRLGQVLTNLFSNAFKFTEQGEVQLRIYRPQAEELEGLELQAENSLAFRVSDTGIGIPSDKLQVIFEAFQQADGTTSRRFGGTGLGLSISRQLARLLGGEIRLQSVENQGSTFTLYVPEKLAEARSEAPTAKTTPPVTSPASAPPASADRVAPKAAPTDDREQLKPGHKTLLLIEDDASFSAILLDAGHEQGYQCLLAENGRDGLELAQRYKPDAIILDIGLPLVDGLTVMDRLKENLATRHIPVHVMSAGEHAREVKQMGALGYSMKPVDMGQLHEAFARFRRFVEGETRRLLIVTDHAERREKITQLLAADEVVIEVADTAAKSLNALRTRAFDCAVLDMDAAESSRFLEQWDKTQNETRIPLIFYAERELTATEEQYLHAWHPDTPLKAVFSPERLVDEATLFLHQIEAKLPEEKRVMLRAVHDKEALLKGRKVLLVDDDMRNVYALSTVLESKGMQVLAAEDGKKALATLERETDIDVVLMDIMMPEMDGFETMRRIRAQTRFRKLPILALTAKAMKEDRAKCLEAGANDYLPKPINNDQMLSLLRVWLYR